MPETTNPADARVRAAVTAADRRRRRRDAAARAWRAAPFAAGAALAVALLSRWANWPAAAPIALLVAAAATLGIYVALQRRDRAVSDGVAASIDEHAGLRGELRSASWFAAREARDEWADLHIGRAADRLEQIDWTALYPPVRSPRARVATSLLVFATLAIVVLVPVRQAGLTATTVSAPAARPARGGPIALEELSPELRKQIEEMLAAAERGELATGTNAATAAEMRELMDRLSQVRDRKTLEELAKALDAAGNRTAAKQMKALADRARQAAASTKEREFRNALEELARNLNEASEAEQALNDGAAAERAQPGEAGEAAEGESLDEASIESLKEAQAAGGGTGVVMMSNQDAPGSTAPPGFGIGGAGGTTGAPGEMAALEQALRQETIEASKDEAGANVETEIRRKTEHGQANTAFTHAASVRSDRGRAGAAAPVPEARRTDVQRYFIRKQ